MKKIVAGLLGIIAFTGLQGDGTSAVKVYLKNNYGSELAYHFNTTEGENRISLEKPIISLGNLKDIARLDVRTTGVGSGWGLSPYSSIMDAVRYIKDMNIPDTALISVNYDNTDKELKAFHKMVANGWQISVDWPGIRKTYTEKPEQRLKLLLTGYMGPVLKETALKLYTADYSEVDRLKKTNLKEYMKTEILKKSYDEIPNFIMHVQKLYNSMAGQGWVKPYSEL